MHFEYSFEKKIDVVRDNIKQFFNFQNGFFEIKMDEFAIDPRARWCPSNNEIVGFCANHRKCGNSWKFLNWLNLEEVKNKLTNKRIHLAKEALFISIAHISNDDIIPKPILILPVCSHTLTEFIEAIKNVIKTFEFINENAVITNVATDGDTNRRKILEEFRQPSDEILFTQMKYFDNNLFLGKYGIKHLIKRIRGNIISTKRSFTLICRSFNRDHIESIFPEFKHLLNPSDYQNVPFAVQLLSGISKIRDNTNIDEIGVLRGIKQEIELFSIISECLQSLFVNPKINLLDQLVNVA